MHLRLISLKHLNEDTVGIDQETRDIPCGVILPGFLDNRIQVSLIKLRRAVRYVQELGELFGHFDNHWARFVHSNEVSTSRGLILSDLVDVRNREKNELVRFAFRDDFLTRALSDFDGNTACVFRAVWDRVTGRRRHRYTCVYVVDEIIGRKGRGR